MVDNNITNCVLIPNCELHTITGRGTVLVLSLSANNLVIDQLQRLANVKTPHGTFRIKGVEMALNGTSNIGDKVGLVATKLIDIKEPEVALEGDMDEFQNKFTHSGWDFMEANKQYLPRITKSDARFNDDRKWKVGDILHGDIHYTDQYYNYLIIEG